MWVESRRFFNAISSSPVVCGVCVWRGGCGGGGRVDVILTNKKMR